MADWINDEFSIEEEEFVAVSNDLSIVDEISHKDARRKLEMLLEEKQLQDDLDDYY